MTEGKTQSIWTSKVETRNFLFEGFGESEADALTVLRLGIMKHAAQYVLSENWVEELLQDACTRQVFLGTCLRDGEPLNIAASQG